MKNQEQLNEYFGNEWSSNVEDFKYSGPALISKINPGETVIDVGCGDNYFRGKIPKLLGIDPANDAADLKVSIEDFHTDEKFDVAFCLGSINFGDEADIESQIKKISSFMKEKSRVYWRCNPGKQDHKTDGCKQIEFFPWSEEWHQHFAAMTGYTVKEIMWDENSHKENPNNRLYAEWVR